MNAPLAKEQMAMLMSDSLTMRNATYDGMEGAIAEPGRGARTGFVAMVQQAWTSLLDIPRRRAVLDELNMLSDRELADVGLTRAELPHVFRPDFRASRGL